MLDALLGLFILLGFSLALLVFVITAVMVHVITHPPRRTAGNAIGRGNPTDPKEAGAPSFETVTVESDASGGIELWVAEGGDPEGPAAIVLHGWADSRYGSLLWYPAIAPAASRVVIYDLRGHGDSPAKGFRWGDSEVDDLLAVIRWARANLPGRVVTLGLSMGGAIALETAVNAESEDSDSIPRADAVVMDSPYAVASEVVSRMCAVMRLPSWPMTPLAMAWLRLKGCGCGDPVTLASRLKTPLLAMVGESDRISPVSDAEAVAGAAPDGELHVFEGVGHLYAACSDRQRYTQTLRDFFARLK